MTARWLKQVRPNQLDLQKLANEMSAARHRAIVRGKPHLVGPGGDQARAVARGAARPVVATAATLAIAGTLAGCGGDSSRELTTRDGTERPRGNTVQSTSSSTTAKPTTECEVTGQMSAELINAYRKLSEAERAALEVETIPSESGPNTPEEAFGRTAFFLAASFGKPILTMSGVAVP